MLLGCSTPQPTLTDAEVDSGIVEIEDAMESAPERLDSADSFMAEPPHNMCPPWCPVGNVPPNHNR